MIIEEFAAAKINLALHVTGKRDDGYHLIDSLVAFADVGDRLQFAPSEEFSLTIEGPFAAGLPTDDQNLICRAAKTLARDCGAGPGVAITLDKQLPVASGIGGGSADAAAALRGLNRLWGAGLTQEQLCTFGAELGADVAMCVLSRSSRATGIGDHLKPVSLPSFNAVLINPGRAVSTAKVFGSLRNADGAACSDLPEESSRDDWLNWLRHQRNDLWHPAMELEPAIRSILAELDEAGAQFARMSGSGATCFGIFANQSDAELAASSLSDGHADWWVQSATLG